MLHGMRLVIMGILCAGMLGGMSAGTLAAAPGAEGGAPFQPPSDDVDLRSEAGSLDGRWKIFGPAGIYKNYPMLIAFAMSDATEGVWQVASPLDPAFCYTGSVLLQGNVLTLHGNDCKDGTYPIEWTGNVDLSGGVIWFSGTSLGVSQGLYAGRRAF